MGAILEFYSIQDSMLTKALQDPDAVFLEVEEEFSKLIDNPQDETIKEYFLQGMDNRNLPEPGPYTVFSLMAVVRGLGKSIGDLNINSKKISNFEEFMEIHGIKSLLSSRKIHEEWQGRPNFGYLEVSNVNRVIGTINDSIKKQPYPDLPYVEIKDILEEAVWRHMSVITLWV